MIYIKSCPVANRHGRKIMFRREQEENKMELCYDGALVLPSSYAVMDEEEMCYTEGGGIYISNGKLHSMAAIFMTALINRPTLLARGITAVATAVSKIVSKITQWIGRVMGGVAGSFFGWAIGAYCGWEFGKAYFNAMVKGKGISVGWGFTVK